MFNIRARERIRVERFDVENVWDDVQICPETSAYIRRLDGVCQKTRSRKDREEDLPP